MAAELTSPQFLYIIAQQESKSHLCEELRREHSSLRLAYSRPGLYTFKQMAQGFPADFVLRSIFARHHGFSLGVARSADEVLKLLEPCRSQTALHVFARDAGEGCPCASEAAIAVRRQELLRLLPERFVDTVKPRAGDLVIDVVLPPDGDPDPWFVGYHRHGPNRSPYPGSVTRKEPPSDAPSRAWSKLEEVIEWGSIPMAAGQTALEIGCAPGGAILAMLDRGLRVIGVDPGAVDPRLISHAQQIGVEFRHIARPCGALTRADLDRAIDWLLCDANLAPQVAIRYLAHFCRALRPRLKGLIFTMKLNDRRVVEALPRLVARVGELGLGPARAVQLPSHRREVVVFCVRRTGGDKKQTS